MPFVNRSALTFLAMTFVLSVVEAQSDLRETQKALDGKATVRYIAQPLSRVLSEIAERHAVEIEMDDRVAIANPNFSKLTVNIDLKNVSLRSVLRILLRKHELDFIDDGDRLLVTTFEHAKTAHREFRFAIPAATQNNADAFVDAVRATLLVDDSSGSAKIDGRELVGKAPRDLIPVIESLVNQIRSAEDSRELMLQSEIDQILRQPAAMNYAFTPLTEAIRHLSDTHGLRIVVDTNAIERAGLNNNLPVTFELSEVDLARSMRFMLNTCGLSYIVEDEWIRVTTKELADSHRTVVVHTLPAGAEPHMKRLRDMLNSRVPLAWAGGKNRSATFKNHLVVYGTRPAQKVTEQFVDAATKSFERSKPRGN